MPETPRMRRIRRNAALGAYGRDATRDIVYLLAVIDMADRIFESQQLAALDPDNTD